MQVKNMEKNILDYVEGRLGELETKRFRERLDTDASLQAALQGYLEVLEDESAINAETYQAPPQALSKIMAKIKSEPVPRRWNITIPNLADRWVHAVLATGAVAAVALLTIRGQASIGPLQFSANRKLESSGASGAVLVPLKEELEAAVPAASKGVLKGIAPGNPSQLALMPGPGMRAIQVESNPVMAAAGSIRPGSHVDVVLTYEENGVNVSRILVPNAQVLSSAPSQADENLERSGQRRDKVTTSLGVTAEDALTIQTGQTMGRIGFILRPESDLAGNASSYDSLMIVDENNIASPRKSVGGKYQGAFKVNGRTFNVINGQLQEKHSQLPADSSYLRYYPPYPYPTPFQSGETYGVYEENPRTPVSVEALSTFSIDVDTGSYANIRRFLRGGSLPPSEAVRIEELINYFDFDHPLEEGKPFSASYELAPSPLEPGRHLLKLGIRTREPTLNPESGWNLVFLIDVSGSMADANKLSIVKDALRLLVGKMRSQDRISIVTFADQAMLRLAPQGIGHRQNILSVIDSLVAGGSTNGSGGLELAYSQAEAHKIKGGVNRVILATDGDFNVGVTYFPELIKQVERRRQGGVSLTTLGVGSGNYKEQTLEQLADKGNGNYHYLDSFVEAAKVFSQDLFANMETLAKDVKVQIEFNPRHVIEHRLIGYDNRMLSKHDFHNPGVDAGEIGFGHSVTVLYELLLAGSDYAPGIADYRYQKPIAAPRLEPVQEFSGELAFLKIRYSEPQESTSRLLTFPVAAKVTEQPSSDFRFVAALSYFGQLLRHSQYRGDYTYNDVQRLAAEGLGDKPARNELLDLIRIAGSIGYP